MITTGAVLLAAVSTSTSGATFPTWLVTNRLEESDAPIRSSFDLSEAEVVVATCTTTTTTASKNRYRNAREELCEVRQTFIFVSASVANEGVEFMSTAWLFQTPTNWEDRG